MHWRCSKIYKFKSVLLLVAWLFLMASFISYLMYYAGTSGAHNFFVMMGYLSGTSLLMYLSNRGDKNG